MDAIDLGDLLHARRAKEWLLSWCQAVPGIAVEIHVIKACGMDLEWVWGIRQDLPRR